MDLQMKPLFKGVDCVSIKVDDLDRAISFYCERLGHSLKWKTQTAAGMEFADGASELVLHTDQRPLETDLLVDSVPEAVEAFIAAGGKLVQGPIDIEVGLFAVVSDPWGNELAILDLSKGVYQVDQEKNVIKVGEAGFTRVNLLY
jgi:predicted enzyme related to lactoylglutathione lyase